jgi:hypothetical protein
MNERMKKIMIQKKNEKKILKIKHEIIQKNCETKIMNPSEKNQKNNEKNNEIM